ncbi:hypothetical protein [Rubinisphaera margarita]|uniref:hypothetical protein n=1 Tax=Rubinisphaera margarita TaxID=2909586 RepID=UPI001EE7F5EF|nr:hypothetical protein [Rubinisphaera margarita]MCG6157459.1 hypothetical protein [Rubinisphaera margarita]
MSPFLPFFEPFGILVLLMSIAGVAVYFWRRKTRKVDGGFEADAILALQGDLDIEVARAMNARHLQTSSRHATLIRKLQIFGDSVAIALRSRNPETIRSRAVLARELYHEIDEYRDLMSSRVRRKVRERYRQLAAKGVRR